MARRPPLSSPIVHAPEPRAIKSTSRAGKRAIAFYIDQADYEEFQIATVRAKTTIQAAGIEMLSEWMRSQGMKLPER